MNRFFHIIILIALSNSIFGQIDTIKNKDGSYEIGNKVNGLPEGKWRSFYKDGMLEYEGSYSLGMRVGKWTWYHENGQILSKESYNKDILTKGKFWNDDGEPCNISIYKKEAVYPGGLEVFRKMVNDSVKYPPIAVENGIFGKVFVQFKINAEGEVCDVKALKKLDPLLDKESIRVVKLSSKWIPGSFHNRPYFSIFVVPIIFSLE
jgi:hypothetical protein